MFKLLDLAHVDVVELAQLLLDARLHLLPLLRHCTTASCTAVTNLRIPGLI